MVSEHTETERLAMSRIKAIIDCFKEVECWDELRKELSMQSMYMRDNKLKMYDHILIYKTPHDFVNASMQWRFTLKGREYWTDIYRRLVILWNEKNQCQ